MNEAPVFTITGELSIYRAAELCQALQAWLPQALACGNDAVYLDLAEVSDMDTAGLQLLLAVQRSAAQKTPAPGWPCSRPAQRSWKCCN